MVEIAHEVVIEIEKTAISMTAVSTKAEEKK